MKLQLSLAARLRWMAAVASAAVLATAAYTGFDFYHLTLEHRLSTTRQVVQQAEAMAQKYLD